MTKVYSYLLTFLGITFWIFRVVVAIMESAGKNFLCTTLNLNIEIIVIFATLVCWLFMFKRSLIASTFYMMIYCAYFGTAIFSIMAEEETILIINNSTSYISSMFGIIISIFTFMDILINKNRKDKSLNQKGSWFYENKDLDRKYDERADKNQYKIK